MTDRTHFNDVTTGLGRLKQLRDDLIALDALEKKPIRFDMARWKDERSLCGTTACAVGYCAMQPWAQEQGLTLDNSHALGSVFLVPDYEGERGFEAAAHFFGLVDSEGFVDDEVYYLFDDGAYESDLDDGDGAKPTIKDVLVRLDEVIAKRKAAK